MINSGVFDTAAVSALAKNTAGGDRGKEHGLRGNECEGKKTEHRVDEHKETKGLNTTVTHI